MRKTNQTVKAAPPNRKKRGLLLIPAIVLLLLAIPIVSVYLVDAPSRKELESLSFHEIDFDHLQDGTYLGSFIGTKGSLRDTTIVVEIANGTVSKIRIQKGAIDETGIAQVIGQGQTVYDLLDRVIERKTMQVDVVSGATLTSKAHLKALEHALLQAQLQ